MRQSLAMAVFGALSAVNTCCDPLSAHDLTSYTEPEGVLTTAGLLERAVDAQRSAGDDAATPVLENFVAIQFTFDPGPVDLCFWDGTADDRENFIEVANSWFHDTSLTLRATTGGAPTNCPTAAFGDFEIRAALGDVATLQSGDAVGSSWSRIGKQGASSPRKVTLFIHPSHLMSPTQRDYIIRHEVGHALGLLHEFQRAECDGHFREDIIKEFYKQRCPGTESQKVACAEKAFRINIMSLVDTSPWGKPLPGGAHDPKSCMNYLVSDLWMVDANDFICRLREPCPKLSDGDENGIRAVYASGLSAPAGPVVASAPAASGALSVPATLEEFDQFAAAAGRELEDLKSLSDTLEMSRSAGLRSSAASRIASLPTASGIGGRVKGELGEALRDSSPAALSAADSHLNLEISAAEQRLKAYSLAPEARALLETALEANSQ